MLKPFLPCSPIITLTWFIFSLMSWASSSGHECFYVLRQEHCKQMVGGARRRWNIVPSQFPLSRSSQCAKYYLGINDRAVSQITSPALDVMQNILIMQIKILLFNRSQQLLLPTRSHSSTFLSPGVTCSPGGELSPHTGSQPFPCHIPA